MPSPHAETQAPLLQSGSPTQSGEQPSSGAALPSSQVSAPSTLPSPQVVAVHWLGLPAHLKPISILQVAEQPSPGARAASSHCSGNAATPSPQRANGRHASPGLGQVKPGPTPKQLDRQ